MNSSIFESFVGDVLIAVIAVTYTLCIYNLFG